MVKKLVKKAASALLPQSVKHRLKEAAEIARYATPDPLRSSVPMSARAAGWLETLRRDGIVEIRSPELDALAAHLDATYCRAVESAGMPERLGPEALGPGLFAERKHQPDMEDLRRSGLGREDQYLVSFRDPQVAKLAFDADLTALCYNYFRRQPYYRNQPVVDMVTLDPKADPPEDVSPIHVDHLRQMSGMLLLRDLSEKSTHMEYYMGSHKRPLLRKGMYMTRAQCKDHARAHPETLRHLTGPAGTLYFFDATAIHRRALVPGSTRKMFHWNMTPGHHLQDFAEPLAGIPAFEASPDFVRAAFGGTRSPRAAARTY